MIQNPDQFRTDPAFLPDQVRDYRLLMRRWKRLIREIPFLDFGIFGEASGYPLMVVESKMEQHALDAPSLYISTGIHGDEPAGVEALIEWATQFLPTLAGWSLQLFPCLNPWGLERNIRCDAEGRDLNRCFNSRKVPQIRAQLALMKGKRYDVGVMLHEDYDARGFYIYEASLPRPFWGEILREGLSSSMSPDPRGRIEGRAARNGLIRRRIDQQLLKQLKGHPEALHLYFHHAERTFTFETPSEESLTHRVEIHKKFLEFVLKQLDH